MDILWDETKNTKLKKTRGVSFDDVVPIILDRRYLAILERAGRPNQKLFVLSFWGYTYAVPFVIDKEENIVLKTVFPSRKLHKLYGEEIL